MPSRSGLGEGVLHDKRTPAGVYLSSTPLITVAYRVNVTVIKGVLDKRTPAGVRVSCKHMFYAAETTILDV